MERRKITVYLDEWELRALGAYGEAHGITIISKRIDMAIKYFNKNHDAYKYVPNAPKRNDGDK